ncbi:hypothetical protein [Frateuria sp. STR12]|uniref:hypothetical protein n=1 Tax=Frateuria hangzhouensis TaxID=2995589 RepID=UPI002260D1F2|nr:hypothetical protein [Frateuria sp. STR12]MCX7512694.1 hypothetical protein [Frateuria sp. STR12]
MANPNLPEGTRTPGPDGVNAGPQSGVAGTGGEPRGGRLEDDAPDHAAPHPASTAGQPREHSSDKAQSGYRARPAGQSGVSEQDERTSAIREPQGDGNYIATDQGQKPLRDD